MRVFGKHGIDSSQHLVAQRHDRALVALAHVERLELVLERTAAAPGGLCKLAQQALRMRPLLRLPANSLLPGHIPTQLTSH